MISSQQAIQRPEILKILFRGSQLDFEIYERLMSQKLETLGQFWRGAGGRSKGELRYAGNGYQRLRDSSRLRKNGDGKAGVSAHYLWDLKELTPEAAQTILVDTARLVQFRLERIHDPRPRELFLGPKLLVRKSPPAQSDRIRVAVTDLDLVFNESYYGYSAKQHPDGKRLVRYLAMLASSKCAMWHTLITSGEFGFEREVIEKFVIDSIPVPPFEGLAPSDLKQIDVLFDAVARENTEANWKLVDVWASSLYGLSKRDLQVISETLKYNLPFSANKSAAQTPPTPTETAAFRTILASELAPWAKNLGKNNIFVSGANLPLKSSLWEIVHICSSKRPPSPKLDRGWPAIIGIADQYAATEIIYPDPTQRCLWLARLKQARYWGRSQARLVARRIAWEHLDELFS